jgi:hypothetical protein
MKIVACPVCDSDQLSAFSYKKNKSQDNWSYDCFKDKKLSQCVECSFAFTSETFEEGSLSKYYNTLYSGVKLNKFKPSQNYEFIARSHSHANFIKTNIDLTDDINILEIGPNEHGMIPSFSLFCKPNYFYYEQLEFPVINYFGGHKVGDYFDKQAASELGPEKKMDLIVLSHSLEHFEPMSLGESVEAMKIALKVNGHVSIEVPLETVVDMQPPHTVLFSVNNMSVLLEKHGFNIVSTQCIKPLVSDSSNFINGTVASVSPLIKIAKQCLSIILPRKIRLKLLMPFYERKLKALYDGRAYLRVLAQKRE